MVPPIKGLTEITQFFGTFSNINWFHFPFLFNRFSSSPVIWILSVSQPPITRVQGFNSDCVRTLQFRKSLFHKGCYLLYNFCCCLVWNMPHTNLCCYSLW